MSIWLQLILPMAFSALIAARVPRRWLLRALAAWLALPAVIYWVLVMGELCTRPIPDDPVATTLFGFLLIASVVAIPWLVLCVTGFGIGFLVRRRFGPHEDRVATPGKSIERASAPDQFVDSPQPSVSSPAGATCTAQPAAQASVLFTEQDAGWRQAHIGFADDTFMLQDAEVWKNPWRALRLRPLHLPHPAYPEQIHAYAIHETGPLESPVRFAASELSNGVWGFYIPVASLRVSDESAEGSIAFSRHGGRGEGTRDDSSGWIVLSETSNGRVLADCKAWAFSHVTSQRDGSLLLRLQENGFDVLLRIAPLARTFTNIGEAGRSVALSTLADALEQTLLAVIRSDRTPSYRQISSDGLYRVDLHAIEWSNAHWVNSPELIDNASGRVLVDLRNTDWDATVIHFGTDLLRLDLRSYGRGMRVALDIDLQQKTFRLSSDARLRGADCWQDLASLATSLAHAFSADQQHSDAASPNQPVQPISSRFAAWRTAMVILAAAVLVIALIAMVARDASRARPRNLDHLPSIPAQ